MNWGGGSTPQPPDNSNPASKPAPCQVGLVRPALAPCIQYCAAVLAPFSAFCAESD